MRKTINQVLGVAVGVALVVSMLPSAAVAIAEGKDIVTAKITLNKSSATLEVGQSFQLRVQSGGNNSQVKWRSSNPKIATVAANGVVKVKKKGRVKITATSKSNPKVSASFKVIAKKTGKKPTKITLKATKKTLSVGNRYMAALKSVKPANGSKIVKWSSSNKKVANVNINGEITALKAGIATITATAAKNKKAKAAIKITVRAIPKTDAPVVDESQIPAAADFIANQLAQFDQTLYVYKDFVDGANYYTQKAWTGSNYAKVPKMREDAKGRNQTTGITAHINFADHSWGGYMFVNGILQPGSTEPELNFGTADAGLNLTGATSLTFWARGERGGERVEFFMGNLGHDGLSVAPYADTPGKQTLGFVTLNSEWKQYKISLGGVNLSRVGCGFGWVSSAVQNANLSSIDFYMDDIRYEFSKPSLHPMFITSYAPAPAGTDAAVINNFAYTYDQSVAAMALSYAGKHERARQIADALVYATDNDRFYADGRLRNAYMGARPESYPGWFSARGKAFAKLPGFYDPAAGEYYEDAYAAGTSTGNCAWAILALLEVYANAPGHNEYLNSAKKIADFVITLASGDGFTGGYEGWEPNPRKVGYKSIEHNTDLITAFGRLAKITREDKYAKASESAKTFVLSLYDADCGCFYTGTTDDGVTISKDVIPLDCQTWTLSVLGNSFAGRDKVLRFIETHLAVGGGYDFDADSFDGVWHEGTAQMGVLYHLVGNTPKAAEILAFLNASRLADGSITAADREGVTTGFMVTGTNIPWKYGKRGHLGATGWLSFLQQGARNPFDY